MLEAGIWLLLLIPTLLWWKESILWVAFMSLYANYKTCIGAHEAHKARKENGK